MYTCSIKLFGKDSYMDAEFAGVVTRKTALILNFKSTAPIKHARFKKSEQVSSIASIRGSKDKFD
jgi:hypothetical protein